MRPFSYMYGKNNGGEGGGKELLALFSPMHRIFVLD